ncbi:GntR family transcriptional regulator [Anaerotignum sp.]|uniref:GntR family transcriptional regulator n=1 Tax=Anaerotignum sp. TaxID=2039241 RepID=UPI002714CA2B|nr:GntR family transcriptional regulator [Anaerotignum sp.]
MDEEKKNALSGKKLTLTNRIYQEIKSDIAKKQFQPGEKLNIKELARKYNVSDTPVKQALQRLADEKLVANTPNKGMSVYLLTPDELNDIFDMRLMMDTFFVKDIVSTLNYNNSLRQQLVENLEEQKRFVQNSESSLYPEKYFAMDLEFHTLYLTASGNQKAIDVFTNLQPFTYATGTYLNQPHYRDCECVAEHEAILKAAFTGDLDALNKAVQVHIENSRRALQLIFKVNQIVQPTG